MRYLSILFFLLNPLQTIDFTYGNLFTFNDQIENKNHQKSQIDHFFTLKNSIFGFHLFTGIFWENQKKFIWNYDLSFPIKDFRIYFMGGIIYLNPLWNATTFLTSQYSNRKNFPIKRRLKFHQIGLELFQNLPIIGFAYFEDEGKALYIQKENHIFLYDFEKKRWLLFSKKQFQNWFYLINTNGENNEVSGYVSLNYKNSNKKADFFLMRKITWDRYDYFSDTYKNKKTSNTQSFLSEVKLNYLNLFTSIYLFQKSHYMFLQNDLAFSMGKFDIINLFVGINIYSQDIEKKLRKQKTSFFFEPIFPINDGFWISMKWVFFPKSLNYIPKVSIQQNKHYFSMGIIYHHGSYKDLNERFYFLSIETSDEQKDVIFFDRCYLGALVEYQYQSKNFTIDFHYIYYKKILQSSLKEKQSLETSIRMFF
ncbi:MAG: hypothetical protein NZ853_07090 [Leptospiraceae bacterium]|nr:hypothetical protein [Leptospiraceae bacterium]MDW7975802.1 hypothetical protein [Leptospiraceae bacterium]